MNGICYGAETGVVTTRADLAAGEGFSDRHVSRLIRLAWFAPKLLEWLVLKREPTMLSIKNLCSITGLPWVELARRVITDCFAKSPP